MQKLNELEMKQIKAGALSAGVWALIAAGVAVFAGFLDGFTRPLKCR